MTTKIYIKMCEKAEEIQKLFEPKIYDLHLWAGNLFHDWDRDRFCYDGYVDFGGVKQHQFKGKIDGYLWHCIWMPTQEQLWKMILVIRDKVHMIFRFNRFLRSKYNKETHQSAFIVLTNMANEGDIITELLFAFIMKEKYNKIWNGKKWEEIK